MFEEIRDETTGCFFFALCAAGILSVETAENGEHDEDRKRERKRNCKELEQQRHGAEF